MDMQFKEEFIRTWHKYFNNAELPIDLPPENDTSYNIVKRGINGQKRIHTRANHQQAQGS